MVKERKLAVPNKEISISQLSPETQHIIRRDLEAHAKENRYTLECNSERRWEYAAMTGRFCDIQEIYEDTELIFCEKGEDKIAYEESIKRTVELVLEDADIEDLCKKAGEAGLKVSELLENFIHDLINGSRTNGSDERMYANQWFDRCWFSMGFNQSFLEYLNTWGSVENTVTMWEELEYFRQQPELDEYDKEEILEIEEELKGLHNEYMSWYKVEQSSMEEEMKNVLEWNEDTIKLKEKKSEIEKAR